MGAGRFRWVPILRFSLGLALIALLVRSIGGEALRAALIPAREHPAWIALAIVLTFLALLAGVVRWHSILRTLGLPTGLGRTFHGFFIGQFFNAFLFGACGGDLARAIAAAHDHPERRAEAVTSVFLDRAIGLIITLLFGCAMLLPRIREFARYEEARPALLFVALFLAIAMAFIAFFFTRDLFERLPWLTRLEHRGRIGPLLRRAYDALFLFRRNARHLFWPAALSIANLLLLAAASTALARALELDLLFGDLLIVFPVVTVLAAVPLTPGSLGVRETLFIHLLGPLGIAPGPALMLSLLGYLVGSLWSLFGGGLFLLQGPGRGRDGVASCT
jgi:glycosyltransferase 2 family protein